MPYRWLHPPRRIPLLDHHSARWVAVEIASSVQAHGADFVLAHALDPARRLVR
jgi:hypothetical protein